MLFDDRREAGELLARELEAYRRPDTLVLGIPRGGVVVGREIAVLLDVPIEVFLAIDISAPGNPEQTIGAVAETGDEYFDPEAIESLGLSPQDLDELSSTRRQAIARWIDRYREGRELPSLRGRSVFLVDDGATTGSAALAAIKGIRRLAPDSLLLAVPVASPAAIARLKTDACQVLCLATPSRFSRVGDVYRDFAELTDEDVAWCLGNARPPAWPGTSDPFFYDG